MRRFVMRFAGIFCLALMLPVVSCSPGRSQPAVDKYDSLAEQGQIQEQATVKASSEIAIHASPQKVWSILTNIDDWPAWQSSVPAAHLDGPLQPGTIFRWTNGGTKITSRIALVRPNQQIAWTGTAYKARAIHIWSLEAQPDGSTLVKTTESMSGFMLPVFFSSKDLAETHQEWLNALKRRAEE